MKKSTARADCYIRVPDFAAHIGGVCFPPEVWAVFAQCDAPRTTSEIARRAHLDEATVGAALRRLARRHLVQKNQLDWNAYLTSRGTPPAESAPTPTPAAVPVVTAVLPAAAPILASPAPAAPPVALAAPVPAPVAEAAPSVLPPGPAAAPPETLLTFVVANASAAVVRRVAARETLTICVGKSASHPANPLLAA